MPTILFHELIGHKIAQKNEKYDTSNFYLGLMVLDSVNAYGFASKDERWRTHFRDDNLDIWQNNIINFYKMNIDKYEKKYLMGYLIHVLTDIACDRIYQNELYPKLLEDGFNYNSAYAYYERGIEQLENSNIDKEWWNATKYKIKQADIIPICGMGKQMILDEIEYTINKYSKRRYEECGFIGEEFEEKVIDNIEKLNLI